MLLNRPAGGTVRIASVTQEETPAFQEGYTKYFGEESRNEQNWALVKQGSREIQGELLAKTRKEAGSGAKIILWGEGNGRVPAEDEESFLREGSNLARDEKIYLGMSLMVLKKEASQRHENKIVFINPAGEMAQVYYKTILVPGGEAATFVHGDGLRTVETPYGKIGLAICYDADSPALMRQAGRAGVDILLLPSNDWREIDPLHTHMAVYRAVENGFTLIRHTSGGLSQGVDYQGRVLSAMDHYRTKEDRALITQACTQGTATIYSRIGNAFAWLGAIALAVILILSRKR